MVSHLVVQVPGLIVLLQTPSTEERFVVDLDELPLRAVAEVTEEAAEENHGQVYSESYERK